MKASYASTPVLSLCILLGGCASSLSTHREPARGMLDLNPRMPVLPASSSPYGTPYGERTALRASRAPVDLESYLIPKAFESEERADAAPARAEVSKVRRQRLQRLSRGAPLAPPPSAYASASDSASAPTQPSRAAFDTVLPPAPRVAPAAQLAPAPASPDAERYAAREARSRSVQEFRGGDAIVITSGALVVALLIVLLLLLLT